MGHQAHVMGARVSCLIISWLLMFIKGEQKEARWLGVIRCKRGAVNTQLTGSKRGEI